MNKKRSEKQEALLEQNINFHDVKCRQQSYHHLPNAIHSVESNK